KVYVYAGADGRVLHELAGDPARDRFFGWPVADAGDVDGDGTPDILAAVDGAARGVAVVSGRTGAELLRLASGLSLDAGLGGLGDIDGDGRGDVLVSTQ